MIHKHYFLGTAAGWSKKDRVRQRRDKASHQDMLDLYAFLAEHYDGEQVIVTKNGRSAIAAALVYGLDNHTKKATKSAEVIVNGFTCRAVVQGVKAAGCTPVFADIDCATLNFTPETLAAVVTDKTKAIIVQNTLGQMVDIREIEQFAREHKLLIIEDLAHSAGRLYPDGREAGQVGDIVVLSFGKEKAVDAVGGGAVIFKQMPYLLPIPQGAPSDKEEFRARAYPTLGAIWRALSYVRLNGVLMRWLLKHGWVRKSAEGEVDYEQETMSDLQARTALRKLQRMKDQPIREFYLVKNRAEVLRKLKKAGYYFDGFWYEKPVAPERYYREIDFPEEQCPNAVFASKHIINFPTYYPKRALAPAREIVRPYLIDLREAGPGAENRTAGLNKRTEASPEAKSHTPEPSKQAKASAKVKDRTSTFIREKNNPDKRNHTAKATKKGGK